MKHIEASEASIGVPCYDDVILDHRRDEGAG